MTTSDRLTEQLEVPGAPAIAGLRFRRFRGESDYPHMVAVIAASKVIDKIEHTTTVDEIARNYAHLDNSDPYQDMLFVEVEGQVVGYNRVWWMQAENGPRLYSFIGFLRPEWRGRGIGRAALRWIEQRLRAIAGSHDFAGERYFQTYATQGETAREALLLSEGYTVARYGFSMLRSLDEPIAAVPLPAGIEVRAVPPEKYRALWEADVEAFRDHWGFVEPAETQYQAWLDSPLFNPALWQVGWDAATGEIAGAVQNFVNEAENAEYQRRRGYTEGIFVRRPWRRRGLARALLTRSLQMFKDLGFTEAALGVDAQNLSGALKLYESVGFRVYDRQSTYRKPLHV